MTFFLINVNNFWTSLIINSTSVYHFLLVNYSFIKLFPTDNFTYVVSFYFISETDRRGLIHNATLHPHVGRYCYTHSHTTTILDYIQPRATRFIVGPKLLPNTPFFEQPCCLPNYLFRYYDCVIASSELANFFYYLD